MGRTPTLTLTLAQVGADEQRFRVGKLNLVDLAGSERLKKTGASGVAVEEARATNMSLLSLGKVCFAPAHQPKTVRDPALALPPTR